MHVASAVHGSCASATRRKDWPRQVRRAIGVAIVALGAGVGAIELAGAWSAGGAATPALARPAA